MAKKYYWLRLQKDFFKRHDIRIIESMPNGKDYILFYLKMLVESIDHEGELRFSETIPYSEDMLATITNTNIDIVRVAMKVFEELDMVEVLEDKTIFMAEVEKMIGSCSEDDPVKRESHRLRQQRYRDRKKLEASRDDNVTVTRDVEIELEIDKELEIEIEEEKPKRKRFTPPTIDEVKDYIWENQYKVDADKWYSYYEANGWKVGKNSMKDWKASIRYWSTQDKKETTNKIDWSKV